MRLLQTLRKLNGSSRLATTHSQIVDHLITLVHSVLSVVSDRHYNIDKPSNMGIKVCTNTLLLDFHQHTHPDHPYCLHFIFLFISKMKISCGLLCLSAMALETSAAAVKRQGLGKATLVYPCTGSHYGDMSGKPCANLQRCLPETDYV